MLKITIYILIAVAIGVSSALAIDPGQIWINEKLKLSDSNILLEKVL